MQDRRTFLGIAAASLLPIGVEAQTGAPAARTPRGGVETSAPRPPAELGGTR